MLNCGVSPDYVIKAARARFEAAGGVVLENTAVAGVTVHPDGVALAVGDGASLTARLLLDATGNASPIVRQMRAGQVPDGVTCVVGSCARGFSPDLNTGGDIIYTDGGIRDRGDGKVQYFWEAFPSGGAGSDKRTTYMVSPRRSA